LHFQTSIGGFRFQVAMKVMNIVLSNATKMVFRDVAGTVLLLKGR
jgi:hypothetical protein